MRRADVKSGAEEAVRSGEVKFRRGWEGVVGRVLKGGDGVTEVGLVRVVSVNWSREWVRGCLVAAAAAAAGADVGEGDGGRGGGGGDGLGEEDLENVRVVANEIEGLDAEEGSTGGLGRYWAEEGEGEGEGIWTAADKGRVVREMLDAEGEGKGRRSVYVGDSVTDLEALLAVDVGICVRDEVMGGGQRELAEVLERAGVECRWIGEFKDRDGRSGVDAKEGSIVLWWARDFDDICNSPLFSGAVNENRCES